MPILPLEPCLFPDSLFTGAPSGLVSSARWWVLHTKPRVEKSLARRFLGRGLPFFLPLYEHRWRSRGRLLRSYNPLFPGYLFLFGDYQQRLAALETNLVVRVLTVEDQDQLQADLARVYHLIESEVPLGPESQLQPGTAVEIVSGPLEGLEGKILRVGKQLKFYVEVQFLHRGVSVEVESWMIRSLDHRQSIAAAGHAGSR